MTREEWKRSWPAWLRATAIGLPFGTIPAAQRDPDLPQLRHREEAVEAQGRVRHRRRDRRRGRPGAANNAAITATLIPLLTLGIPTSNTAAILLGAFQNYGIQPGPQLLDKKCSLGVGADRVALLGNVMLLVLNLPMVGLWVKLLKVPEGAALRRYPDLRDRRRLRHAPVGVRSGAAVRHRIAGLDDAALRLPGRPVVIGMILGPLAEAQMRNAMSIGEGKWSVFVERPGR